MIQTWKHLTKDQKRKVDICIIGSGAGGAAAFAHICESSSKKVLLLEGGSFLLPRDFSQKEEEMFPRLFFDAGGRRTKDRAIRILHGHGLGGSTVHNINLCKRIPRNLLDSWGLDLEYANFQRFLDKVEADLGVSTIEEDRMNANNRMFKKGVEKLGYRGGLLQHNRKGCMESGFCELGCAFNAKMNAMRVYIPMGVKKGGEVYTNTRAIHFEFEGNKAKRLIARVLHPVTKKVISSQIIEADQFILAGGAIESPLLLKRSNVPDPHDQVGKHLRIHPGAAVSGEFEETINSWEGIPQSYECTEFLSFEKGIHDKRIWLVGGSAHPVGAASVLPGFGEEHFELMKRFPHFSTITPMLHDESEGTVDQGPMGSVSIDYSLNHEDRKQLEKGLYESAKILLAAGAKRVLIPGRQLRQASNMKELDALDLTVSPLDPDLVAVHPMGTLRMGKDPKSSCTTDKGLYHHLDNLWVADTSLYTTSLGVPPQISTYAFGLYVAQNVLHS